MTDLQMVCFVIVTFLLGMVIGMIISHITTTKWILDLINEELKTRKQCTSYKTYITKNP